MNAVWCFVGAVLGSLGMEQFAVTLRNSDHSLAYREGEVNEQFDRNHDGRIDEVYIWSSSNLMIGNLDMGFTGLFDYKYAQSNGMLHSATMDNNRDGIPDVWYSYTNGRQDSIRYDLDFNGVVDLVQTFDHGRLFMGVLSPNGTNPPSSVYYYSNGVLAMELRITPGNPAKTNRILRDAFERPIP